MDKKTVITGAGAAAVLTAVGGIITAVHGSHATNTAISRNDTPVVINRPHDANGSPLPVTVITPGPHGGPPIVIVGHGAPAPCSPPSPTPTPTDSPAPTPTATPIDDC